MTTNNANKGAFRDYEPNARANKGLKLQNKKVESTKESVARFERAADELMEDKKVRNEKAAEYTGKFRDMLKSKVLPVNKSIIEKELEQDVVAKLVRIALEANQDETEPEGIGAVALINLLLKISLMHRDRINELEFKLAELKPKA